MPLIPSNFAANSLSGTVRVSAGYANVVLTVSRYAFEDRTKTFTLKLRRDAFDGPVIAQSNTVTLRDFSEIVSLTANTSTVAEGNLVSFTLVTANVVNGANVFFSVLPVTANITAGDFFAANTGRVTINSNQGTFALFANADYSLVDEANETFRVQIRTVEPTGNIVFVSSNVAITDFFKRINIFRFEENSRSIVEGTSVTFTVFAQNLATGTLLHYYTTGNAGITGSNTGSIAMNSVSNTITITSAATVPGNESRSFSLVLSESSLGAPIATSNAITVVDSAAAYLNATGGTVSTIDGFRIHTFTSSNTFSATNFATAAFNTANILVIAGGGGGANPPYGVNGQGGGGGGGGGFVSQTQVSLTDTLTITVGGGGSAGSPGGNGSNSLITGSGNFANVLSVGGGGGGGVTPGRPGGSGGGASNYPLSNGGGGGAGWGFPGPTQQGYPGGYNYGGPEGAGGGGAGGYGGNIDTRVGGPGAISTITGSSVAYSGGGQGSRPGSSSPSGPGAPGGGGAGAADSFAASAGTVNTGGGGGGGQITGTRPGASGGSGIVIIRYQWRPPAFYSSVTPNVGGVYEGANVFFVVNTTFANAVSLFYDTVGNVTSSNFVGGNTGSFTITSNATVISLQTIANIPENESRNFALRIREDSPTGNIVLISSNVGIYDDNQNIYIAATGGNVFTLDGFRTHIFTNSNNFVITDAGKVGSTIEYFMVAGGGGGAGGQDYGGGGAGGVLFGSSSVVANSYVVTVGAGAASAPNGAQGNRGSNTSVIGATTIGPGVVAVGGGGGGAFPISNPSGTPGGSGGGAGVASGQPATNVNGASAFGFPGILGSTQQGFPGGGGFFLSPTTSGSGGGGGAGAAGIPGGTGDSPTRGNGGVGISSPLSPSIPGFFGTPGPSAGRWFAGGGGGGSNNPFPQAYIVGLNGGAGGGGFGFNNSSLSTKYAGNVNTGGGGGSISPTAPSPGPSAGGSGIVVIRYPFIATPIYTSVTTANTLINEGANVTFTIRTENANANVLFYTTVGNVISADFVGGNTGSFTVTGDTTTLTLSTTTAMPADAERTFQLQVRRDSTTGPLKLTSNTVYVYGTNISVFIAATGGNVFTSGGFRTHIFTSSNTFAVTDAGKAGGTVEYFMVAGGGGGGLTDADGGGGGGAGGVLFGSSSVVANTYTVTVGSGGSGYSGFGPSTSFNGGNSSIIGATIISSQVAVGGGGGGTNGSISGKNGGSGGGSITSPGSGATVLGGRGYGHPGTIGSTMQGFPGGSSAAPTLGKGGTGGGGGGSAASNVTQPPNPSAGASAGGIGLVSPLSPSIPGFFGTPGPAPGRWFAGGGGGGGAPNPSAGYGIPTERGAGGIGGGGSGAPGTNGGSPDNAAILGNVNTGGGGGGGTASGVYTPPASTAGSSGIVIIRYPFA